MTYKLANNRHHKKTFEDMGIAPELMFGCAFRALFKPTEALIRRSEEYLKVLSPPSPPPPSHPPPPHSSLSPFPPFPSSPHYLPHSPSPIPPPIPHPPHPPIPSSPAHSMEWILPIPPHTIYLWYFFSNLLCFPLFFFTYIICRF